MIVLDFETRPITAAEPYPEPVGFAIWIDGSADYIRGDLAHLHRRLRAILASDPDGSVVMHNGVGFDLGVARKHLGITIPVERVHDTLVLSWLDDPYRRLALKPLAQALLDMPPEEQDDLRDWILANLPEARRSPKNWGAWISYAPPELVEPYAKGDAIRTAHLFELLSKRVRLDEMWSAYRREIAATPILLDNEMRGIPCDAKRLLRDVKAYERVLVETDEELSRILRKSDLDLDSAAELADRLQTVTKVILPETPSGQPRTDVDTLAEVLPAGKLRSLLLYRSALAQDFRTFLLPWSQQAQARGHLYTHWNLVGGTGRKGGGTRTGRLSSEPNFQNITSTEKREALFKHLGPGEWPLPSMRSYIVPDPGHVLVGRDYSQQELRLFAHFENSDLLGVYKRFPDADLHAFVGKMIAGVTGVELPRKTVKVLNFCTIYGGGTPAVAAQGGMSLDEAQRVRDLYFTALPSVQRAMRQTQAQGRAEGIRTIGGRIYEVELAVKDGRSRDLAYRLVNYQIQGSAADQMKEALGQLWARRARMHRSRFLLTVHDELLFSAPKEKAKQVLRQLDEVMVGTCSTLHIQTPFKTDGYMGPNWAEVRKEKGL